MKYVIHSCKEHIPEPFYSIVESSIHINTTMSVCDEYDCELIATEISIVYIE